tara:strand:+ start:925 stop:1107 length:183 start_codon:yes stop_codon:yes gene_type:complete
MNKEKYAKWLSITAIILSVLLASFGVYTIFMDNNFLMGFIYISLGFSVSINDWIKIFKNK